MKNSCGHRNVQLYVKYRVLFKNYRECKQNKWIKVVLNVKLGGQTYEVRTIDEMLSIRHTDKIVSEKNEMLQGKKGSLV